MSDKRPSIPEPIKREVRQRCGFGCVICGLPIYDYEHMEEWAKVQRHIASEITLLCPEHHREKTSGRMHPDIVKEANANPYNLLAGISKPKNFHFIASEGEVRLGKLVYPFTFNGEDINIIPLIVHGFEIMSLKIQDSNVLINMNILNEKQESVLTIQDNTLIYKIGVWDIEFVGKKLTIRNGLGDIFIEIMFEHNTVSITRGNFYSPNMRFDIREKNMLLFPLQN